MEFDVIDGPGQKNDMPKPKPKPQMLFEICVVLEKVRH